MTAGNYINIRRTMTYSRTERRNTNIHLTTKTIGGIGETMGGRERKY